MRKVGCLFLVIAIIAVCVFLFPQKSNEEQIEATIENFIKAYNQGDFEKAIEYLDAKSRNAMQGYMNLLEGVLGKYAGFEIDMSDLFSMGIAIKQGDAMSVKISDIRVTGESNAVAVGHMDLYNKDTPIYFIMTREDGKWLISDMTDVAPD